MADESKFPLAGLRTGAPAQPQVTTDDMSSYNFGMSPEDMIAFDQYKQAQQAPAATGALDTSDYYPGTRVQPGATGNYSGSVIGSTSLYGGGAALTPIGIFDAQDAAVQKATAARLKEVDDFRKTTRKAPTSKLANINDSLTREYFSHQQNSWNKALKRAGGDPALATKMLQNDPEYFAKTKSYEDLAKLGDSIVEKTAQDEEEIKSGKFNPTPGYIAAKNKLYTALDPQHPDFKNVANIYRTMQVERDFSDALDQVSKRAFAQEIGKAGVDLKDPEFIKEWQNSKKEWSPEQIQGFADTLGANFFSGSDYWTKDRIKKNVEDQMRGKVVTAKVNATQKREDNSGELDYTDAQPMTQTETNMTTQDATGAPKEIGAVYGENAYKTNATHEKTKLRVPIGEDVVDTNGKKINTKSGYVEGTVSGIQNGYYDRSAKRFLTKAEAEKFKQSKAKNHNIVAKTIAVLNAEPEMGADGVIKAQNTIFVDANEIKGKFKNPKKKDGQKDFDDLIDANKKLVDDENKANATPHPAAAAAAPAPAKAKDFQKKYNY